MTNSFIIIAQHEARLIVIPFALNPV